MKNFKKIFTLLAGLTFSASVLADINPQATYINEGEEVSTWESFTADAPLHVRFTANPSALDPGATLEWHIRQQLSGTNLTRYEENMEYDFTETGIAEVALLVRMGNDIVDSTSIRITISGSHLEMPNAFSPNGDEFNQYYQAKSNYKSIVHFHAYIFNRWGQKLYEWTDYTKPESGWDGTFHGTPVKDGVYYVLVKARGADGIEYNIRRDVNLIRKFNEVTTGSSHE